MKILNFINSQFTAPASQAFLDNYDPARGEVYSQVPDSDERDVVAAVNAARAAAPGWAAMPARERSHCLRKIASLIIAKTDELARAESIDTGKPFLLAKNLDIFRSAHNFEFFADSVTQTSSESYQTDNAALNFTMRAPLGVVGCISPWNLPLYLLTWKIAPALATGNCVVAKPSEVTPMTAHLLAQICLEAGLPGGVLNLVHGLGPKVGLAIIENPHVAAISFTGSTKTGAAIATTAAASFKKVSLEMGGKNPTVIFADCDFEEAVSTTVRSAFLNQGQICLCGSRIFVEKPIYEKFKRALIAKVEKLKLGDPMAESTDQGAVVSKIHFDKIMAAIALAKKEGGQILTGGSAITPGGPLKNGWFIQPTLIEGLSSSSETNREEIFGPVATLQAFDGEDEVVAAANSNRYGLAANVWTQDIKKAHRIAAKIDCGIVWVNCWMLRDLRTPFGGMKNSGVGREGGLEALRFFTEPKNICVKL